MPADDFRIYRGEGHPAVRPPGRPVVIPRLPRERLTDPAGYKADPGLVEAVNVALHLGQPLLLTGEAGTGKTLLARSLAWELSYPQETYEVKSTSTASDLFYTYNALAHFHVAQLGAGRPDPEHVLRPDAGAPAPEAAERPEQLGLRYLRYNALGAAIVRAAPLKAVAHLLPLGFEHPGTPVRSVVLLDEIDKAPRDLPNDVLSALDAMAFTIPELGNARVEADPELRPVLVLTSNSEKALPDPLLRRCIFYHIEFPGEPQLREIVLARLDGMAEQGSLLDDALKLFGRFRQADILRKKPATAELLGWLLRLRRLADATGRNPVRDGTSEELNRTLPCLMKTADDVPMAEEVVRRWVNDRRR
jgi:MoxR-like ATPase